VTRNKTVHPPFAIIYIMSALRDKLTSEELAMALSNYDLGVVRSAKDFPRGAHGAAKLIIESDRGSYLLKRRPKGKDDPQHVAFAHAIQDYLAERSFPLPHLINTRSGSDSLLRIRDGVYELFEYIDSQPYDASPVAASEAGRILGLFHRLIAGCPAQLPNEGALYHNAPHVLASFKKTGELLLSLPSAKGREKEIIQTLQGLRETYKRAAGTVEDMGIGRWASQIIHGDWHPGNMLFDKGHVVAVIDFDSARMGPRILDVANGILQFSFVAAERDLNAWEARADDNRARRFLRGYDNMLRLSEMELKAIPHLMQEALIAQTMGPILRTGMYASLDGAGYLDVVLRKTRWLEENAAKLALPDDE